jgi:hypothetical protein
MENPIEYKILEGYPQDIQTKLNQWRHDYKLRILANSAFDNPENHKTWCVMVISRKKLEKSNG